MNLPSTPSSLRPLLLAVLLLLGAAPRVLAQARVGEPINVPVEPDDAPTGTKAPKTFKDRHGKVKGAANPENVTAPPPAADKPMPAAPPPTTPTAAVVLGSTTAIAMPTDNEASLIDHWRKRLEDLANHDAKRVDEEERAIEHIKRELSLENLLTPAAALLREADMAFLKKQPAEALARCKEAEKLAPGLNLVYLCIARASFAKDMSDLGGTFSALNKAIAVTFRDVRAQRNAFTDLALTLLLGFALACGVLILLILARYAKLFVHDFHHLFPQGVSTWQSAIVAAVLVVLPALLGMGLLGSVALAAVAVALLLARAEAIALVTAFVLLAGAQYVVGDVLQSGAFGRTAQDVYLLERGDAPEAAALRLQGRSDHGLGNYATAFALGHYHKRFGRLAEAKIAYDAARKIRETPELTNNIGNVLFLQGDTDAARKNYNESIQKNSSLPAPYWNLAKIYFREGKLEIGTKTTEQARSVDPEGATASAGEGQGSGEPDANSYMKDVPLSDSEISKLADDEASAVVTGGGATWSVLTGRAGASLAIVIALLAALLVGAAQFLQPKLDPSSYCERCGRPVCVRCDPELGQTKGMCGQCISVFVRRTGVDGPDRLRKEIEVRQFRRRSRLVVRALGALWGGGGHIFAGRVIGGSTFITLFALLFSQVVFWHGIFRSPMPVHLSSSAWHVGAYVGAFVVLYALSLVHLMRYEEAD